MLKKSDSFYTYIDGDEIKGHKIRLFRDYNIIHPGGIACYIFSDYDDL